MAPRTSPAAVRAFAFVSRVTWIAALGLLGLLGCNELEPICAGPCAKAAVCQGTGEFIEPLRSVFVADEDGACPERCATWLGLSADPCQSQLAAFADCLGRLSCESLDDLPALEECAEECCGGGLELLVCLDDVTAGCARDPTLAGCEVLDDVFP